MLAQTLKKMSGASIWLLPLCLCTLLSACGGLGYVPPPGAKLGDAFLSLTIGTLDRSRMPQGADIVISIEDPMQTTASGETKNNEKPTSGAIIGDVIKLSQADSDVKVNFPIDRGKLSECGKSRTCYLYVKIIKNGKLRYKSNTPAIYKAGQTKATIAISKAT